MRAAQTLILRSLIALFSALLIACGDADEPAALVDQAAETTESGDRMNELPDLAGGSELARAGDRARLLVHKSETCGCCALWVEHLIEEGIPADVQNELDMESVKSRLGVTGKHRSCHTAVSRDGYVFEGHVPAIAIKRFLQHPPEGALGLAVPGMPVGSPGMEVDDEFQPYQIMLLMKDGTSKPYGYVSNYESQFTARSANSDTGTETSHPPHDHD